MRRLGSTPLVVALLLALFPAGMWAEEPESGEVTGAEEEEPRHGVAFFLGVTDDEGEQAFSLGLDYEYRLNRVVGIGGMVDYAFGDLRDTVLAVPLYAHPNDHWKLFLAPGVEIDGEEENFLVRLGVNYVFDVGAVGLAPTLIFDFVDSDVIYVYGLGIEWES